MQINGKDGQRQHYSVTVHQVIGRRLHVITRHSWLMEEFPTRNGIRANPTHGCGIPIRCMRRDGRYIGLKRGIIR